MIENNLTQREKEIFYFMKQYCRENGCPPSCRELAHKFFISSGGAFYHLQTIYFKLITNTEFEKLNSVQ